MSGHGVHHSQHAHLHSACELLRKRTGLLSETLCHAAVERAFQRRLEDTACKDGADYLERLRHSSHEWDAFIDEIVVPETWFFRDREPFAHFREWAGASANQRRWLTRRLRVLSAPCATGEEPYSIAMTLLDIGMTPRQFHIDALDISHSALRKARAGVFRPRSIRGELPVHKSYFERRNHEYALQPLVISTVSFRYGNIIAPEFLAGESPYDAIFCRNLLIYFDVPARERAVAAMDRLLHENGVLYIGHADPVQPLAARFNLLPHSRSFAYGRKIAGAGGAIARSSGLRAAVSGPRRAVSGAPQFPKSPRASKSSQGLRKIDGANGDGKSRAAQLVEKSAALADAGRLHDAEARVKSALEHDPGNGAAWRLLGMIHESHDRAAAAAAAFTKALYLDAGDVEAMVQLALIYERDGRTREAALLRSRARRAEKKQEAL